MNITANAFVVQTKPPDYMYNLEKHIYIFIFGIMGLVVPGGLLLIV